jgi:outer membrane protein assembly factor BamB
MFGRLGMSPSNRGRKLSRGGEDNEMRSRRTAAAAALVLVGSLAGTALARPIPSSSGLTPARPFLGTPRPAEPVTFGTQAPRHPFMAPNGLSNIHDDAYQSDAYTWSGPLGFAPVVRSTFQAQDCASVTFDSRGRIVSVCVGLTRPTLELIDPRTLQVIASYPLPPRNPGTLPKVFTSFGGGGYFYLDNLDRAVVPTNNGMIYVVAEAGNHFRLARRYDLRPWVKRSAIISALPDWSGRIWFVTANGVVGFVNTQTRAVHARQLHEAIGNSFAVDETGAVFIVTDAALYRFDVVGGVPHVTWRVSYDHGSRVKPGQTEHGSGTTPTIVRRGTEHFVAITDNADPRMHVLVYRADATVSGSRLVCSQPVFAADKGDTDNSLIAIGDALIVENNYGYTGPSERPPTDPFRITPTTEPGVDSINVDYANGGCRLAWANDSVRVPSSVSKASAAAGLVYVYEHPAASQVRYAGRRPPHALASDPWYLTALDITTGRRVWSVLTGYGLGYNNNYAPITIGRDGTAYVGVLGGLVSVHDSG